MLNIHKAASKFFITTPIYYVNASPHLGHLYSSVIADCLFRFKHLTGNISSSIFSTGTDEHGIKVFQAANDQNVHVRQYCNKLSEEYKSIFSAARIGSTDFVRTTEERHQKAVYNFWNLLKSNHHITKDTYAGWYSVSDECFLTESQLKTNYQGNKVSAESGHAVEWTEEINYIFKLKNFQKDVVYWAEQEDRIKPKKFKKILLDMLSEELPNLSISRPSLRMKWGIQVPGDSTQNIYVWLDALVNYLTCAGYPETPTIWPPSVQVLGKDILKFHGIYWPAFLMAAGMEPPNQLLVHSHWLFEGKKMSKSVGNVINPTELAKTYTMDGIRYFLLREGVQHSDGNYSNTKLLRILNSELADTLGNLMSRTCAKSLNPNQEYTSVDEHQLQELLKLDITKRLIERLSLLPSICFQQYSQYNFHLVVDSVIAVLHLANNFFESTKPWELKKGNDVQTKKKETILSIAFHSLETCSIILQPIIPNISANLLNRLNVSENNRKWNFDNEIKWNNKSHNLGTFKENTDVLFKRILSNINNDVDNNTSNKK